MPRLEDQKVSQTEFARVIDTSQATVSHLIRRNVLPKGGTLGDWTRAYVAYQVSLATQAAGTDAEEVAAEKLALLKAKRELAQHEAGLAKERVVSVDEFGATIAATFVGVRQGVVAWVGSLPSVLQHQDPATIQVRLQAETRDLLGELQRHCPKYAARVLAWLVEHAPPDLWTRPVPFEAHPLSQYEDADQVAGG